MKHIPAVLVLCAVPATALAQTVSCRACDHIAPYFRGTGGFIGTVAEGTDEVVFLVSCGSVTITGEAQIHGDTASQLFNHRNGLACDREGGTLEVAGVEDGGWYWITADRNSAVGPLVRRDILNNGTTPLVDAGPGVTVSEGRGAVFLREVATGRVGVLLNILPVPPPDPVNVCDYTGTGTGADPYVRETKNCMLGDGKTVLRAEGPADVHTARRSPIPDGGHVLRPLAAGSSVEVTFALWGNGSGHFTSSAEGDPRRGHLGGTPLSATLTGSYTASGPAGDTAIDTVGGPSESAAGLSMTTADNVATVTIMPNGSYCSRDNDYPVTVTVTADAIQPDEVAPNIVELNPPTNDRAATHVVTVRCS